MAGREPGGRANARANSRPAGLAVRRPRSGGSWRGGLPDPRAACGPALAPPPPRPRCRPEGRCPAARGRQASVPTAPPGSCLGRLRLLEVLVGELAVLDVVDRLDVGLLAGLLARGRGAGLLLERGDPLL